MTTMQVTATETMDREAAKKGDAGHFVPFLVGIALVAISGILTVAYIGLPH